MLTKRVFLLEKKFYCHPVIFYAASKDGAIVNVKSGKIKKTTVK